MSGKKQWTPGELFALYVRSINQKIVWLREKERLKNKGWARIDRISDKDLDDFLEATSENEDDEYNNQIRNKRMFGEDGNDR